MPLADKTNWQHRGTTEAKFFVDVLAERLQALEDLLNEYFVNSQFLKSMRKNGDRVKPHRTSVCPQDNNDV
ncbi:hypothetical protein BC938DRAFT_470961 [Jimgerdemannia flammicorona]|uniref:Uncharacterized protein n=1 Tax=Jimgerdemannia flammicorona TaxID=994334 RepID=A0A433R025_9FUNG|nr:hypothetical protein BC938DRAFT_470961 [Jimgerdemannia flammicorona]